jgi:DnaD/phage-associated family protein
MNYLKEINAFNDWLLLNSLSTGAIALWYQIMAINNKAGWAEEFTVANLTLQSLTGLSRQGLERARNSLVQKGLIEYKKGTSNKAGKYKVISFECKKIGTGVGTVVGTNRAQEQAQSGHSGSTLIKLNETKDIINNNNYAREEINLFGFIEKELGYPLSPTQMEMIEKWQEVNSDELIRCAVSEALAQNIRNFAYIDKILLNWETSGVKTIAQVAAAKENFRKGREVKGNGKPSQLGRKDSSKEDPELDKIDWSRFGS